MPAKPGIFRVKIFTGSQVLGGDAAMPENLRICAMASRRASFPFRAELSDILRSLRRTHKVEASEDISWLSDAKLFAVVLSGESPEEEIKDEVLTGALATARLRHGLPILFVIPAHTTLQITGGHSAREKVIRYAVSGDLAHLIGKRAEDVRQSLLTQHATLV